VLLGLPRGAPRQVFQEVEWSTSGTCESQKAAIRRSGIEVSDGTTHRDVDEFVDYEALSNELGQRQEGETLCPRLHRLLVAQGQ